MKISSYLTSLAAAAKDDKAEKEKEKSAEKKPADATKAKSEKSDEKTPAAKADGKTTPKSGEILEMCGVRWSSFLCWYTHSFQCFLSQPVLSIVWVTLRF